jgi:hypothetical protein
VVKLGICFETIFYLLDEIKLFMEKKGRNIEGLNDDGWITDIAVFGCEWSFE